MNDARAGELPAIPLNVAAWFRSVKDQYKHKPPFFEPKKDRFNPGRLQLMYFAPDPLLARFEARDVLGHWFGEAIPSLRDRHVVVEYRIELGLLIIDARATHLATVETTVQEMTGDWENYGNGVLAPTQKLASAVFGRPDKPMGLMAPSARNPLKDNLILFAERLPPQSISYHTEHRWHPSQL